MWKPVLSGNTADCMPLPVSAGLSTNEDGEEATLAGQMMTIKADSLSVQAQNDTAEPRLS